MNRDEERAAWVGLARAVGSGRRAVERMVHRLGPRAAWDEVRKEHPDIEPRVDLDAGPRSTVRVVCRGDDDWPDALADLGHLPVAGRDDAGEPFALWIRGGTTLTTLRDRAVAVVGARDASDYGRHVAGTLAASLADLDWAVVSGAAFGIDAAAHRGALAGDGLTVAVLAGGVDVPYPRAHSRLLDEIAEKGAVVSEAPPGAAPYRHSFLRRNRLIAALSAGTVLVEAGQRSGALNTTGHARRLGRPVMVVPGPVTSRNSIGCHELLRTYREETAVVTRAEDVLEEVGPIGTFSDRPGAPAGPRDHLDALAHRVLDAVPARAAAGPAEIARAVRERPEVVLAILGPLVTVGLVERGPEGYHLTALGRAPSAARTDERGGPACPG